MSRNLIAASMSIVVAALSVANVALAEIREQAVAYKDGDTVLKGFVTYDDASNARRPGVIVVHEWWGINQHMRDEARRYAAAGYTAFVADMYGEGRTAENPKDARALMDFMRNNPALVKSRFAAAQEVLMKNSTVDASRIGAAGYSFGGWMVLDQVLAGADLKGAAIYYAILGGWSAQPKPGVIKTKILVQNGGADPVVKPDMIAAFDKAVADAGIDSRYLSYPGAKHAYTNPDATAKGQQFSIPFAYSAEATAQANAQTTKFFGEVFK